jgi:tetratricopeptide (TPR) repeat protein
VFDDANPDLQATLETQLTASIETAEKAMDGPEPGEAALWGGSSHLLLAELRAAQRRPLAAAFEAKRAKRLLESDTLSAAAASDALFGLGTYNYVADTVPSYVKGLRALLFLPKGNRAKGLEQLEQAASQSRSFAIEARILLITIYSNKHERLYGRALDERDRLLHADPDAIASIYAAARLELSLGRSEDALARLARAEARERRLGDVDPVVLRSVELLHAQAELAMLRPDLAHATAAKALATGAGLGPSIRDDLVEVAEAAKREAAGIEWPPAGEARSPIFALLAGDARLRGRQAEEALAWFARVDLSTLPPDLQAACRFRQARAKDLLGHRAEALELYTRVAATTGFVARDGAFFHQVSPYTGAP